MRFLGPCSINGVIVVMVAAAAAAVLGVVVLVGEKMDLVAMEA
jgi:hypothetical protein